MFYLTKDSWKVAWFRAGKLGYTGFRRIIKTIPLFWEEWKENNFCP